MNDWRPKPRREDCIHADEMINVFRSAKCINPVCPCKYFHLKPECNPMTVGYAPRRTPKRSRDRFNASALNPEVLTKAEEGREFNRALVDWCAMYGLKLKDVLGKDPEEVKRLLEER